MKKIPLFWRKRSKRIHILPRRIQKLAQIDLEQIHKSGIKGIILDLDNTIISEDDRYLSPGAEDWLTRAKLAGLNLFILSNGKRQYRVKFWSHRLNIPALSPAKKPFPAAFRQAIYSMKLTPKSVVVIGDSLHTDMIGAWLCGCRAIQVASLPHPPRWWEKIAGKWIQIPYLNHAELWEFDDKVSYESFR